MSILSLFDQSEKKKFAASLVERLVKELPPRLMAEHHKVLTVNKITRLLERNAELAAAHGVENKLGFIGRAMLANAYKWALKNAGYKDDFVDVATECLVVTMSKKVR